MLLENHPVLYPKLDRILYLENIETSLTAFETMPSTHTQRNNNKKFEPDSSNMSPPPQTTTADTFHPPSMSVSPNKLRNDPKPYDQYIYPEEQAKKLYEYSEFIQNAPRAKTPAHMASKNKNARNLQLAERKGTIDRETQGVLTAAPEMVSAGIGYKHLKVKKKNDFDRDFRLLGNGGDFSEVRYQVPDELTMVLNERVGGPAMGRQMRREKAERDRLELEIMANENDAEKKKRKLKESADRKQARREAKDAKQDWRVTKDPDTRIDTDFMTAIFDDKNKPKQFITASDVQKKGKTFHDQDIQRQIPDNIGPKTRTVDYKEIDRVAWQEICKNRTPVKEQLKGRMVEEREWDLEEEQRPIEENKYIGVTDDRLENYKQQVSKIPQLTRSFLSDRYC